jgi:hypothetical protein
MAQKQNGKGKIIASIRTYFIVQEQEKKQQYRTEK